MSHRDPAAPTARLFLGLSPPDPVREALQRHADCWAWPRGAARVRPDKLHATLHFIGAVPRARVPELVAGLAVPFEPFELHLHRVEVWPGGIAVVGPAVAPPALVPLHAGLHRALEDLGLSSARPTLRPHVTLARRARGAIPPAERDDIVWPVDGYALIESDLRPPTQYRIVAAWR
jgi:2'-5' RNA ligase